MGTKAEAVGLFFDLGCMNKGTFVKKELREDGFQRPLRERSLIRTDTSHLPDPSTHAHAHWHRSLLAKPPISP